MSTLGTPQVLADEVAAPRQPKARRTAWLVVVMLAVAAPLTVMLASGGSAPAGCEVLVEPLVESATFTPYELRRDKLPEVYLNPGGAELKDGSGIAPSSIDGLPLRWMDGGADLAAWYYDSSPVSNRALSGFVTGGGIQLVTQPVTPGMVFGVDVPEEIGERGTEVMVGEHPAWLTWADPDRLGTRTHNLYWSDGVTNYSLIADRPSNELVNLARGLACSGEL